ncbi:E3 ubiquitin-protein ligase rnf168-like [Polyodon spathula]|uniref:E3 ubiquitin-protein ligase rnf168-like n=1 Tax=Polyodon spathula TaxID=7913 RepID=UPI001B7E5F1F|nr:E3 ubiquitin-protein ligase rnf168-like [Polyodon spathula]XP_041120124.1 E3 ubiquitin-protein ligase rnf168-like [Polyodon spathula]
MPQVSLDELSQADCICPICLEIFLEPVTLPCDHTFCKPCFQQTVDKSNLCCPLCRKRVSTWARLHARNKTLVNEEMWERVQKAFPVHCQRRLSGQDQDDPILNALIPQPQLCKPGELRREYEDQKSKLEAEKRVLEEEERRASEEYIQQLAEDEERRAEESRRAVQLQLENDARLAQMLVEELNTNQFSETHGPSTEISRQNSSGKKKKKTTSLGNIEKYFSPVSNRMPSSLIHAETSRCTSLSANKENISAALGGTVLIEDGILTLRPQEGASFSEQPAELPLPKLSFHGESCHHNDCSDIVSFADSAQFGETDHKLDILGNAPKAAKKINTSTSDKDRCFLMPTSTDESENSGVHPRNRSSHSNCRTGDEDTSNGTYPSESDSESNFKSKRLKVLSGEGDPPEGEEFSVDASCVQQLKELENDFFSKLQQEKTDRLLALQLQRQLNKEMKEVNRKKNSPDGYLLRIKLPKERASCSKERNWSRSCSTVRGEVETTLPANRPSGSMLTTTPIPIEEAGSQKGVSSSSGSSAEQQIYGKQMTITKVFQNHVK